MDSADILILVIDVQRYFEQLTQHGLEEFLKKHLNETVNVELNRKIDLVVAFNKCDLLTKEQSQMFEKLFKQRLPCQTSAVTMSCAQGDIDQLMKQLKISLENLYFFYLN